jgi:hypothetical protein
VACPEEITPLKKDLQLKKNMWVNIQFTVVCELAGKLDEQEVYIEDLACYFVHFEGQKEKREQIHTGPRLGTQSLGTHGKNEQ